MGRVGGLARPRLFGARTPPPSSPARFRLDRTCMSTGAAECASFLSVWSEGGQFSFVANSSGQRGTSAINTAFTLPCVLRRSGSVSWDTKEKAEPTSRSAEWVPSLGLLSFHHVVEKNTVFIALWKKIPYQHNFHFHLKCNDHNKNKKK